VIAQQRLAKGRFPLRRASRHERAARLVRRVEVECSDRFRQLSTSARLDHVTELVGVGVEKVSTE
jgi:hypothetical protein